MTKTIERWLAESDDSMNPDGNTFRLVPESAYEERRKLGTTARPSYIATVYSIDAMCEIVASHNQKAVEFAEEEGLEFRDGSDTSICTTCKHEGTDYTPFCKRGGASVCAQYRIHMTKAEAARLRGFVREILCIGPMGAFRGLEANRDFLDGACLKLDDDLRQMRESDKELCNKFQEADRCLAEIRQIVSGEKISKLPLAQAVAGVFMSRSQGHSTAGDGDGGGCLCQECGERYKVDMNIPDDLWNEIRPSGKPVGAGLLCGACIMKRIEARGEFGALTFVR